MNELVAGDLSMADQMVETFTQYGGDRTRSSQFAENLRRSIDATMAQFVDNAHHRGYPVDRGFFAGVAVSALYNLEQHRIQADRGEGGDRHSIAEIMGWAVILKWCIERMEEMNG